MFEYITHKHVDYCFERELRAVAFPPAVKELGSEHFSLNLFEKEYESEFKVFAPIVDVQELICSITLNPEVSSSFKDKIIGICENNSLVLPSMSVFGVNE